MTQMNRTWPKRRIQTSRISFRINVRMVVVFLKIDLGVSHIF